ncbi:PQQ-dependent sugar dehydrogenase [Nonomuraea zeae]|uniref:Sorbosone dehydrogenase family protein n=1 Tax=Nonomuraea zeae TaxID=1642303 RepID=A0A5S4GZK7_9ACTN|nr:sorbosone dehydrogenase family protein [Nonomuraea zeae]TMR38229.1 sorbosone dehydrogenase family protein [Nonomuraea zeae]
MANAWRRPVIRIAGRALLVLLLLATAATAAAFVAVNRGGRAQTEAHLGSRPRLGDPDTFPIPKVNPPDVVGWPPGKAPTAPRGFSVTRFEGGLEHPRWLYQLPNGDVLVAESATLPKNPDSPVMGFLNWLRRNDGSTTGQSANRITLLRDTDGDGVADFRGTFLDNLHQPFGMALLKPAPPHAVEPAAPDGTGVMFYVAGTDGVWRFPHTLGETRITAEGQKILDLPAGGYNNHWTRNLLAAPDGSKLYVTVGSASNAGEHGLGVEHRRAAVLEVNPDGSGERLLASGLRNPNGLAVEPATGTLWAVVNERDALGDDTSPDYLTRVRDGDFYGWPWSYWGTKVDDRVRPARPDLVAKALRPDYSLGAHTAPLGLAFATSFPEPYRGGAFIGEHGSWNRGEPVGYKVVHVPFADGMPSGKPRDFLTGFRPGSGDSTTYGRPVGVIADKAGGLLVADDAGNTVWRVAPTR